MKKIKVLDKPARKVDPKEVAKALGAEPADTSPVVLCCSECGGKVLIGWWWRRYISGIGKISCAKCKEGGTTRLPNLQ